MGKTLPGRLAAPGIQVKIIMGSQFTEISSHSLFTVDYGYYQNDSDSPHTIVTSGVSTWGIPIRIGTNNEIVNITIR